MQGVTPATDDLSTIGRSTMGSVEEPVVIKTKSEVEAMLRKKRKGIRIYHLCRSRIAIFVEVATI